MQVVTERIPNRFGLDPIDDVRVLTPMNRGGLGARSLNVALRQRLNPNTEPRVAQFGCGPTPLATRCCRPSTMTTRTCSTGTSVG